MDWGHVTSAKRLIQTMNRSKPILTLRAALIAAGFVSAAAYGQVQKAGELYVDIDATQLPEGSLPSIKNNGTLGGSFAAVGGEGTIPVISVIGGTKGIQFDGTDFLQNVDASNALILAPVGLIGADPTRSIEVWTLNPDAAGEETLVSWGKRGGPNGSNVSFGYGSDYRWGAVGHWGGDGPDVGWSNSGGNPPTGKWHHLVYTLDQTVARVYADGVLMNAEVNDPGTFDTHADTPISIATQMEGDGTTPTAGLRYTGWIARVRVHDGVLTPEQILNNYNAEKSAFIDPQPPAPTAPERLSKGPVHRYSFSEAAATDAADKEFKDSVGTAHGKILGGGTALTGSRLQLGGGPSADAGYGDLPNGLLSRNGVANGGTGKFTFETWFRISVAHQWSRVFDFGSSVTDDGSNEVTGPGGGGEGRDYLAYTAQVDGNVNSRRLELRNEDPAGGGIATVDVPTSTFGRDAHVVLTWDEGTGNVSIFENGVRLGGFTTDDKMSDINDVNVWLGRSNWTADQNTQGEYDEVRFYDYVLTPGQILGNSQGGADLINDHDEAVTIASPPTDQTTAELLSATFSVSTKGSTPISYQWYRNGTLIGGATGPSYTVSNASAADQGAQFTVEVSNTVNGAPVKVMSPAAKLTLVADTVTLKHRYSFNETSGTQVTDSVGGKNGEVLGNGALGGGSLTLDGSDQTYVNLPNGLLTGVGGNGTIEFWITSAGGPAWARVFDFGVSNGGEDVADSGLDFLFFCTRTGPGFAGFTANFPDGGDVASLAAPGTFPLNTQQHVVITWNATANTSRLYTNGTLVASATAPKPLSAMNNQDSNVWLGRSQWPDPFWNGKYNEFRLYSGAMSPSQIAASLGAGPDKLPSADAPSVAVARDGTNARVTFTGSLESASDILGPWTPVTGSSPLTVPAGSGNKFYRAKQ